MGSSPQSATPNPIDLSELAAIGDELRTIGRRIRRLVQRSRASMRELADWCESEGIPVIREDPERADRQAD